MDVKQGSSIVGRCWCIHAGTPTDNIPEDWPSPWDERPSVWEGGTDVGEDVCRENGSRQDGFSTEQPTLVAIRPSDFGDNEIFELHIIWRYLVTLIRTVLLQH
ncbi:MAG: hypothetical protein H6739_23455 [Alphaproteobacteria bacterium]|nr:hypothetical protein [Alphaproteobacteria bacterium]